MAIVGIVAIVVVVAVAIAVTVAVDNWCRGYVGWNAPEVNRGEDCRHHVSVDISMHDG